MSEDLDKKINHIKELLGKDGAVESLKNILSPTNNKQSEDNQTKEESGLQFDTDTINMIFKMKNILDSASKNDDPREKLIKALKPYLSDKRQDKADEVIKILKMTNMVDIVTKLEGNKKND